MEELAELMRTHLEPLPHEEYSAWLKKHFGLHGAGVLVYYPRPYPADKFHKPNGSELDLEALSRIAVLGEDKSRPLMDSVMNVLVPKGTLVKGKLSKEAYKLVRLFHWEPFKHEGAVGVPAYAEHSRLVRRTRQKEEGSVHAEE